MKVEKISKIFGAKKFLCVGNGGWEELKKTISSYSFLLNK